MGLLSLVGIKPTKAQVGAANDPAAHAPTVTARTGVGSDDLNPADDAYSLAVTPNYRAPSAPTPPDYPSVDATLENMAATHARRGPVDPRATFAPTEGPAQAGSAITPLPFQTSPESLNDVVAVPADAGQISWPDRYRAGGTSADNTRVSRRTIWYFLRPFDKGVADRFMTSRWAQSSPLASQPLTFRAPVPDQVPYAGGGAASPGMNPVYIQPNSSRLLPNAWDQDLYNGQQVATVDASANYGAQSRASGWRAG